MSEPDVQLSPDLVNEIDDISNLRQICINLIEQREHLLSSKRSIEAEAELTFQFLPDASFSLAASYLEFRHSLFRFDTDNAFLNIAARGDWSGFSVTLGVSFRVSEWSDFAPSIIFSYIS